MPTERMKPINLFVPFEPIERRSANEPLVVSGYCFRNETVPGEGGVVLERAAMEEATPQYMRFGAVREMHQPLAAGTALSADWDEHGCKLTAKIVDPVARMKCEEGVYKGFSLRVVPLLRVGNRVKKVRWPENSLVDAPGDPDCDELVLHRAEGFDPEQEVECEVVLPDDPGAADAAPSADPPPATADPLPGDADEEVDAAPAAPAPPTLTDAQQRVERGLLDGGLTPELAAQLAAASIGTESVVRPVVRLNPGDEIAAPAVDRGISSATPALPVRENLEPRACPAREDAACERGCDAERCELQRAEGVGDAESGDVERAAAETEPAADVERGTEAEAEAGGDDGGADPGAGAPEAELTRADLETRITRLEDDLSAAIQRADVAEANLGAARDELGRVTLQRDREQARAESLAKEPAGRPVVRFPGAMQREFLANFGAEGEAEVRSLREAYVRAKADAARETDENKKMKAIDRMIETSALLSERGVRIE